MRNFRESVWVALSALTIVVLSPLVAQAYMVRLDALPARTMPSVVMIGRMAAVQKRMDGVNADVPLKVSFVSRMSQSALTTPTRALWAMYPAAVRGRAFGGTGADPLISNGRPGGW